MPYWKSRSRFRLALLALTFAGIMCVCTSVRSEGGGVEPPVNDPPISRGMATGSEVTDYFDLLLLVVTVT